MTDDDSSSTALVVRLEDGGGEAGKKVLSEDLIVEIFTRLPVKSLMRFRYISKHWYNLVLSPNFISMHSALSHHRSHHKNVTLQTHWYDQTVTETIVTFRFDEHDLLQELTFNHCPINEEMYCVEIVGSSNGVVCLSLSPEPQTYALCNPATREVRVIAECPFNCPFYWNGRYHSAFCFDPATNSFKVAQIEFTGTGEEEETRAQVHVFSTATNSWTQKKNMNVPCPIGMSNFGITAGVECVTGYLHWRVDAFVVGPESILDYPPYILSYDMINEAFEWIEMPPSHHASSAQNRLSSYKGSLAVFVVHSRTASNLPSSVIDVWVRNGPFWSKILTCKPSIEVTFVQAFFSKDDVNYILFYSVRSSSLYLYDPVNGTMKPCKRESTIETFPYCETLASLN